MSYNQACGRHGACGAQDETQAATLGLPRWQDARCERQSLTMTSESSDQLTTHASENQPSPSAGKSAMHKPTFSVLVPLDGSDLAAEALVAASAICAGIPGSEVICMRVIPLTPLPYGLMSVPEYLPADVYQRLLDDQEMLTQEYLASAAHDVSKRGIPCRALAQRGDPAATILDESSQLGVNLITMTTHGRTGLARFALGSVADRIVRGGSIPVLLLRSFHTPAWSSETFQRALIPLDGSLLSEAPLMSIVPQLAGTVIHHITLAQIVDPRNGAEAVTRAENYLEQAQKRLIERLGESGGERTCEVETLVRAGPVAATIQECAQSTASGVIVMATHGEAGIGRLALGGITDRILRDGQTPLLLVPPQK